MIKEEENMNSNEKIHFIKWFSELNKDFWGIAGIKGANLSEIYNLKIPVPPGFVITTQAYDYFIEKSGLKERVISVLQKTNYEDAQSLKENSEKIQNFIINSDMPRELEEEILEAYENLGASDLSDIEGSALDILHNAHEPIFVAVRSSAIKEYPNVKQDYFLNIKGEKELIHNIKLCFASLFNPNKIYIMQKENFTNSGFAVIVQKMIDSTKSGVITSKDNTNNGNITIESVWGLGSFDTIIPDKYILDRDMNLVDIRISDKKIAYTRDSSGNNITVQLRDERSKQQVLTKNNILKLAEISFLIEEHYKLPQKLEFVIEGNELYIIQNTPIQFAPKKEEKETSTLQTKESSGSSGEIFKEGEKINRKEITRVIENTKTKLKPMVDLPNSAENVSKTGINSSLIRIENIITESGKHPNYYISNGNSNEYEEIIFTGIREIGKFFDEMWVKTSDIRSDRLSHLEGAPKEKENNPRLGLHGIRYSLKNPQILEAELNALKRVSEIGKKIGILLPNVSFVEEIQRVKEILHKINFTNVSLGVIIETPAAIQIINQLCDEGIKLICLDITNLTQNILVMDNENKEVQEYYNELHPAILYQLGYIIRVCKKRNVQSNMLIHENTNKEVIKFLVENGVDSVCAESDYLSELSCYIKEIEENMVKGTDKEPRRYIPKQTTELQIKDAEKINAV